MAIVQPDCLILPPSLVPIPANEHAIRRFSPKLAELMDSPDFKASRVLPVNLNTTLEPCFRQFMDYTLTGDVNIDCSSQEMTELAEQLGMQALRDGLPPLPKPEPRQPALMIPTMPLNPYLLQLSALHLHQQQQQHLWQQQFQLLQQLMNQQHEAAELAKVGEAQRRRRSEMKKSSSMDVDEQPFDNMGDVIIPSNDKEGWCRNKKYIEKTENGFMCTVCRKVYGRYNSVSYHVTIYHRNPPIKCDLPGCQFTTREARYIHFHKYYRHGVALPQNIDQGTRRCPYCRHVSKSPAMLEKHIRRHQNKDGESSLDTTVDIADEVEESRSRATSQCESIMEEEVEECKPRALTL